MPTGVLGSWPSLGDLAAGALVWLSPLEFLARQNAGHWFAVLGQGARNRQPGMRLILNAP